MSDNVENCEDNVVYELCYSNDCECNSSSGGSVYQEMQGRIEECPLYSTDDEFLDATETLRSPLLSEDPEEQLSAPILKQLTEDKEHTRYLVLDMPSTDSESANNSEEKFKENSEKGSGPPSDENMPENDSKEENSTCRAEENPNPVAPSASLSARRIEKIKSARTLRLPSARSMPIAKPDRPARGDGRVPIGASRIPVARTSTTKVKQLTSIDQNTPTESESCHNKTRRIFGLSKTSRPQTASSEKDEEPVSEFTNTKKTTGIELCQLPIRRLSRPPTAPKPKTASRPTTASSKKEKAQLEDSETRQNINTTEEHPTERGTSTLTSSLENNDDDKEAASSTQGAQVTSIREGSEIKRMRVGLKPTFSRDNQEKPFSKVMELSKGVERRRRISQIIRESMYKDRLVSMNKSSSKQNNLQKQIMEQCSIQQHSGESTKFEDSQKPQDLHITEDYNISSQMENSLTASLGNEVSETNCQKQNSQKNTPAPSPSQASPIIRTIAERRRQLRKSREGANDDKSGEVSNKNANMPEIKPLLIKPNQLKTYQVGLRHQENTSSVPMKTLLGDETSSRGGKNSLAEKRKHLMKQRAAAINKNGNGDAKKILERHSRERTSSANQKPTSDYHNTTNGVQKPSAGSLTPNEKTSTAGSSIKTADVQVKALSGALKVNLASLQNVYKTNYKRYEEQLGEVEKAKKRLCISLGKLGGIRQQIIENYGEDPGEITPPLDAVQPLVLSAHKVTTQGMNTEEGIAESFLLLGNNQKLLNDIETLKRQLEEAKKLEYFNKKEADTIPDLRERMRNMSLTLKLAEKKQQDLEKKMEEQQEVIVSLKSENLQMSDLKKILKQKDQQLMNMKKQNEEKNKEVENAHKKIAEVNACHESAVQEGHNKREKIHFDLARVMDERNCLEKQLHDVTVRFADFEEREECLHTRLENEKKKVLKLEEELNRREGELSAMEKKFIELEMSSSTSVIDLSQQLTAKEAFVHELESLRANVQSQNRELCCLISDMFALKGKIFDADQIQAALSAGTLPVLREELMKMVDENSKALDEARFKVNELQNQVKILQIELEDSKMMSERLTNVIAHQKSWESDKPWEDNRRPWSSDKVTQVRHPIHNNFNEGPIRESFIYRDSDINSIVPSMASSFVCSEAAMARNNFNELFVLLEGKRRALVQMERKLHDMEEVHSHCAQKRTRNETRIAQLEMMLATHQG